MVLLKSGDVAPDVNGSGAHLSKFVDVLVFMKMRDLMARTWIKWISPQGLSSW